MNWRLPQAVRSKRRVRLYWLFRRIRRLRQARNHPTHPHTRRPVYRLIHSILLIPSSKFSPAARARVSHHFGNYRNPITSNSATVEFARAHPKDEDTSKLATLDATIYTTDLFHLPAGGVGLAIGGQWRREQLSENPDMLNLEGDIVGNSPV